MSISKLSLILLFIFFSMASQAQIINNKLNISLGLSAGYFQSQEIVKQGNFSSPSLFANYKQIFGYTLKCMKDYNTRLSYGLSSDLQFADVWESSEYSDFNGSSIQLISFSPIVRFKSMFREEGLFNRLQAYIELGPNFGISYLTLTNPVFDIRDNSGYLTGPMKSSDLFLGLKSNLGIDYSLNQSIGFYLYYSIDVNRVSSKLYSDQFLIRSCLNAGLLLKLKKNKYFYRTQGIY